MNVLIFLILISLFSLMMIIVVLPFMKISFMLLEWEFLSFKLNIYLNSLMFSVILGVVTLTVLIFSTYYLNNELNFNYYYFMLLIFVGSMFMLNFSNNVFAMLISWDLLGISSFFLVLFYNNWDSNSGAMNTALTNRLGDFFLFTFFSGCIFVGFYFINLEFFNFTLMILLLLTSFTKSAQFPFSSWLPKAMSAPTPVSSLVHSSTLVTAGLILLMNFWYFSFNIIFLSVILIVGSITMFFSSVTALIEEDMKKVVALSTLSQMGFSMMTLGLGLSFASLVHLMSHALFKSCLFMQVGYIIHSSYGQQDGRNYGYNGMMPMFVQLQLLVTLFCLCGLMFSSGMVSKDLILEMFFSNNNMMIFGVMIFVSIFLTFCYSYRLWKSLFLSFKKTVYNFSSSTMMNILSLMLIVFSIFLLWWMNYNMFVLPILLLYVDFYVPLVYLMLIVTMGYFIFKLLFKELIYKFLVDYLAKNVIYKVKNVKFFDLNLNKLNFINFNTFGTFGNVFLKYMGNFKYNNVIFLIFLIYLVL
uniref:NADH:ubiquinone reductase (H(+)-translocating) n=1 Tax=Haemonchus placei TaxID=6290 RepID=A0A140HBE8_HAEPC|nr:NADH dehydrogenase subunit 5 [Haemonchus placei]AMO01510.1 NADH dehydrogenase subunit 5 [Haemonchus placei]BAV82737.1 NADH dehydrogenase subunit 5 [Haemonchus placei]